MCRECSGDPELAARCRGERSEALRRSYLFAGIDEGRFETLLDSTREVALAPGQWLCFHGEPARECHFVLEGEVALLRQSAEGEEFIVAIVGAGEHFGEELAGREKPVHPLSARALSAARVTALELDRLRPLVFAEPAILRALLETLDRRNAILLDEIERVTVRSAGERLLDFLASDAAGEHPPRLSKRTLASRLSIRPETLSRVVRQLKDEGLLDEIDGRLVPLAACDGTAAPCRDCPGRAWGCPGPRAAAVSS